MGRLARQSAARSSPSIALGKAVWRLPLPTSVGTTWRAIGEDGVEEETPRLPHSATHASTRRSFPVASPRHAAWWSEVARFLSPRAAVASLPRARRIGPRAGLGMIVANAGEADVYGGRWRVALVARGRAIAGHDHSSPAAELRCISLPHSVQQGSGSNCRSA